MFGTGPGGGSFQTCQNCHMPDETGSPAYACDEAANNHQNDLPVHQFAGGNTWIPDVLRQAYPEARITIAARPHLLGLLSGSDWADETLPTPKA